MNFIVATRYAERIPRKRKKRLKKAGVKLSRTRGFHFIGTFQTQSAAGYFYNVYVGGPPSLNIR